GLLSREAAAVEQWQTHGLEVVLRYPAVRGHEDVFALTHGFAHRVAEQWIATGGDDGSDTWIGRERLVHPGHESFVSSVRTNRRDTVDVEAGVRGADRCSVMDERRGDD